VIAMLAEIIGPELLIVFAVIVVFFGGSQLPKLARSIGRAKAELSRGLAEGDTNKEEKAEPIPTQKPELN
jgi:sec-independent protein translocase protein TatA